MFGESSYRFGRGRTVVYADLGGVQEWSERPVLVNTHEQDVSGVSWCEVTEIRVTTETDLLEGKGGWVWDGNGSVTIYKTFGCSHGGGDSSEETVGGSDLVRGEDNSPRRVS